MALGLRRLLSLLVALALPAPTHAATTLTELTSGTKPAARRSSGIAIDPNGGSDLIYIFGGYGGSQRNDLWYYDTAQSRWVSVPAGSPPAVRDRHALGFDRNLNKLVVFGGLKSGFPPSLYSDLYIYGPTWTALTAAGDKPTGRMDVAFHWMPHLNKFLMFGGATAVSLTGAVNAVTNELWTLEIQLPSTAVWTKLTPGGTVPGARGAPCTGYDEANRRLIVYGGMTNDTTSTGGTFVYDVDSNTWYSLTPSGTAPSARGFCASAYDAGAQVLALYGGAEGATPRGDAFLFAPDFSAPYPPPVGAWSSETPTPTTPGVLSDAPAAFSTSLGGMVFFGGQDDSAYQDRLWLLRVSSTGDTSPPVAGTVDDGTGADLAFQTSTSTLNANWTAFSDPQSAVTYTWAIGTSAGAQDVMAFTSVGITGLTATKSGLSLASGTTYYVTVKATNAASLSTTASSNGVKVDDSVPVGGAVNDGTGADLAFQTSTTTINANWAAFSDSQSGVTGYRWAIGTSAGAQDVMPFTSSGIVAESASASGLPLLSGVRYYVTVEARNGAGLVTTATSDGVLVDDSPPSLAAVNDGPGADRDAQNSATLEANWAPFADAETSVTGYRWAIGTSAGGQDVLPFTSSGITGLTASKSGLPLVSGTTYFVTVEATNEAGLTSTATSDGVFVDLSAPSGGTVEDGSGPDVDWQATSDSIAARWSGFTDTESGVSGYRWAIGTSAGAQDVMAFTSAGITGLTGSRSGLALVNGATYYVTVEATNGAGLTATATSDGVRVDGSVPVAGTVSDGTGADVAFQTSTATIQANWTAFIDGESGVTGYRWAIGTSAGAEDVMPFTAAGVAGQTASRSGLALVAGTTYFVTVEGTNGAGLASTASSNGVTVDDTAPASGTVNDGTGADLAFQTSTTTLEANWTAFTDGESAVGYRWAIGTSPGAGDVMPFTTNGITGLTASRGGLSLVGGTTYFVTVEATNGAGLTSRKSSDGVRVDSSAPLAGAAADGAGADVDVQASSSVLECNWLGFDDPESGITGYRWAVGTTPGAQDVLPFTSVGIVADSASASGLPLTTGLRYYVTVEARNGAGLTATATSDGVVVDATPPGVAAVNDGAGVDRDAQGSTTVEANWGAFPDAETGTVGYRWAVGTSPGAEDVMPFTSAGITGLSASRSGLPLASGTTYFVTVEATNGVGLSSISTSDGVLVDLSPPNAGSVEDGTGPDVDWQTVADSIRVRWSGFSDPETGIASYRWGVGTAPDVQDVLPLTSTGIAGTSATASGLSLVEGQSYFVTVEATNGVGLNRRAGSDGVSVDTSVPLAGAVSDGLGADVDVQPSRSAIAANWSGFADAHSGIIGYEWAVGTAPQASDVRPFQPVGLAASDSASGLNLAYGTTYYVTVRATNAAGLSVLAVSDGVQPELPAAELLVSGICTPVRVGEPVDVVVEAREAGGAAVSGFADQVRFSTTDPDASVPPDYTFVLSDGGRHAFVAALVFHTPGMHTVTVTDVQAPMLVGQQAGIEVVAEGPPLVSRAANTRAAVGVPYRYNGRGMVIATGDPVISYGSCGGPAEFFVEPKSGAVRWTPQAPGTASLCVRASNGQGSDSFAFDVQVEAAALPSPSAAMNATPDRGPAPMLVEFDGSASAASPGASPLVYEWFPGDGSSPGTASPWSHTYARPGGYQARLRVYDALGSWAEAQAPVRVQPADGRVPPTVRIVASAVAGAESLPATLRAEGVAGSSPIVRYLWELEAGVSREGESVAHTFGPGRYLVRLTALDALGLAGTDALEIAVSQAGRAPPSCRAWADPPGGPAPHQVSFSAFALAASDEVASLEWDFGAQGRSTLAFPVVSYPAPGWYTARLRVTDAAGLACDASVSVVVTGATGQAPPRIVAVPTAPGRCGLGYPVEGDGYRPLVFADARVTWSLVDAPPGMRIDPETGALSWRPDLDGAPVTVTLAADNAAGRDERTFVLTTECASGLAFQIVGCGCSAAGEAGTGLSLLLGAALLLGARRRARR